MRDIAEPGLGQQLLDNHFRLLVFAFAEVVMPDVPLRVGEVEGGPVVVSEGTPYRIVVIDRDRVTDPYGLDGPADVIGVLLKWELRCVHPHPPHPWVRLPPAP